MFPVSGYWCARKDSDGWRKAGAGGNQRVSNSAQPSSKGFGSQAYTLQCPLITGMFETLCDNLFATTFDDAASYQVTCGTKLSAAYTFKIVTVASQRLFH
ncbi:MAG TPA: hypothetical protein VLA72_14885 [Anaerolineales bacterium]|nr:hypothetical protein [Anaerolineales bacterium]